jgi:hypothetical protein
MSARDEWERQALRIYRRYATEFVEALGICPWAAKARADGAVRERVLFVERSDADGLGETVRAVVEIGAATEIDIGLLVFPWLTIERDAFEAFVERVREGMVVRRGPPPTHMAMAAFHPDAPADVSSPGRLVSFVRRAPDPTIQLVRSSALDRVRRASGGHGSTFLDPAKIDLASLDVAAEPPVPIHERIGETNARTIGERGLAHVDALLADIARDRAETYARLRAGA